MLLLPRLELVFMIFLNKAARVGTRALLAPGLGQRTCCPSLSHIVSHYIQFTRKLSRLAHLEPCRVHFEAMGSQTGPFKLDHSVLYPLVLSKGAAIIC